MHQNTIKSKLIIIILLITFSIGPSCKSGSINGSTDETESIVESIITGTLESSDFMSDDNWNGGRDFIPSDLMLHTIIRHGKLNIISSIIDSQKNINQKDLNGNTPLHFAAFNFNTDLVELLISKGANINSVNNNNQTPLHFFIQAISNFNDNIPSFPPLKGYITSNYGIRRSPISGLHQFHYGIDIAADEGTEIKAAADGVVTKHGWSGNLGNVVIIKHEFGFETIYGHCKKIKVRKGTKVKKGELIAFVGSTGASTGNHCHYEIRLNNTTINPLFYLNPDNKDTLFLTISMIKLFHSKNADFNKQDNTGRSVLHYSAYGSIDAVNECIINGSNLNSQDIYGFTPLHYAVLNNDIKVTKLLLKNGAKINIRSTNKYTTLMGKYYLPGTTCLKISLQNESLQMAKLLLRHGGRE